MGSRPGRWLVAAATVLVLLGLSIAPFLTPLFVRAEQDRVAVGGLTGFSGVELDAVTGALLGDLVLWQGDFDVAIDGAPVLSDRERGHMRDVRDVFTGFWILVVAAAVVLVVASRRARGAAARAAMWRAIAGGARALAIGLVAAGVFAIFAFDAAFELFHRLFFSSGTYTFDPARDRLVQLFPLPLWSETTIIVGAVILAAAILTAWLAGRRAGAAERSAFAPSTASASAAATSKART